MFEFLRWFRCDPVKFAKADIEKTLLRTFNKLYAANKDPELLTRRMNVVAALASTIGAIRDVYPKFPIEDENIALAMIEANANGQYPDANALLVAILNLVERCPNTRQDKIDTVTWMLMPQFMKDK